MTTDLLIHERTKADAERFVESPGHALLLCGPSGSGKKQLAKALAEQVLKLEVPLEKYPYATIVGAGKGSSIGIEAVRSIEHFLSLKVPAKPGLNRAVLIEDAQLLTGEAQNALLKTLEEPPLGTLIIMTVDFEHSLLPTIRSRVQSIAVKSPSLAELTDYFKAQGNSEASIKRAYSISGGLPGLMRALLSDEDHPLLQATEKARQLLSQSSYERMLTVDELAKQKALALDVLFILQQMAHVSLQSASGQAAKRWQNVLTAAYEASEQLAQSAQPKLVLTKLMLSM